MNDIKVKDKTIQIDSENSLTDKIFPQLNTKSKLNFISKGSSRPFSSVMSATKSKTVNKGIQPLNSYFLPNMNYVYKSPSIMSARADLLVIFRNQLRSKFQIQSLQLTSHFRIEESKVIYQRQK